jgi:hypothetical protein
MKWAPAGRFGFAAVRPKIPIHPRSMADSADVLVRMLVRKRPLRRGNLPGLDPVSPEGAAPLWAKAAKVGLGRAR